MPTPADRVADSVVQTCEALDTFVASSPAAELATLHHVLAMLEMRISRDVATDADELLELIDRGAAHTRGPVEDEQYYTEVKAHLTERVRRLREQLAADRGEALTA